MRKPRGSRGLRTVMSRWCALPRRVVIGSAVVTLLAAAALPLFGSELMPPFREGHFVVQAYATPGTSLAAMRTLGARVTREVLAIPGIVTVEQTMGRAESGEDTWEPNRSEFHVELKRMSGRAEGTTQAAIGAVLQHYPSVRTEDGGLGRSFRAARHALELDVKLTAVRLPGVLAGFRATHGLLDGHDARDRQHLARDARAQGPHGGE